MLQMTGWIAVFALLFSTGAWAISDDEECASEIYTIIKRDLRIEDFAGRARDTDEDEDEDEDKESGSIVSNTCKTWPYKPELTLAALAYDAGVEYEKKFIVAIIDKKGKHVVSSHQGKIYEDATIEVGTGSLRLDTARYQLSEGVRAFGVRFRNMGRQPCATDIHYGDELTLLVPEGKSLRPVLRLFMHQQQALKGDFCPGVHEKIIKQAILAISVEETSNGFHDLRVTANISTEWDGDEDGDRPSDLPKPRVEHVILRYNGKHYEPMTPWWLEKHFPLLGL
jgi:hypothetical protein